MTESHCYQGYTERPEVTNARYEANKKLREQVKLIELRHRIEEEEGIDLEEWKAEEDYRMELAELRHG